MVLTALSFGQTLDFVVLDSLTYVSIENAEITIWDNNFNHRLEVKTDKAGSAVVLIPDSLCKEMDINIKVRRPNYLTQFFSYKCNNRKYSIIEIFLVESHPIFDTFPIITYGIGMIEPTDSTKIHIPRLGLLCMKNPEILFTLNFEYSKMESNGYELSVDRANYLARNFYNVGFEPCEFEISVKESSHSKMTVEIIW